MDAPVGVLLLVWLVYKEGKKKVSKKERIAEINKKTKANTESTD